MAISKGLNRLSNICGTVVAVGLSIVYGAVLALDYLFGGSRSKAFSDPVPFLVAGPFLIAAIGFSIGWGSIRLIAWIIEGFKSGKKENGKE
jgi:hypothetical protein